jgi:hypothetical protein
MKKLKLKMALQFVYDRQLDFLSQYRNILSDKATDTILESARKFIDTQDVFDGERDV